MTERQIVNWLLGFVIGILTVLAWQRVMSEPVVISQDTETTRAEELINIYQAWRQRCTEHEPGEL
jgi:hypothetical protein